MEIQYWLNGMETQHIMSLLLTLQRSMNILSSMGRILMTSTQIKMSGSLRMGGRRKWGLEREFSVVIMVVLVSLGAWVSKMRGELPKMKFCGACI